LAVLGAALSLYTSVGFLNAFGVFQSYYKTHILPDRSDSDISWIGSLSIFLLFVTAPISGILADRVGPTVRAHIALRDFEPLILIRLVTLQILLCFGSVGVLLSIFMTSLCKEYWQFILAQSLLLGPSMSFITWPPVAVVSRHFPRHRGLVLGLVVGGSSIGGITWPVMLEQLLTHDGVGFPWTMRIVGFNMLPLLVIACLTVRDPPHPRALADAAQLSELDDSNAPVEKPKGADYSILKNRVFVLLAVGLSIGYIGLFTPIFYVTSYAVTQGVSTQIAFYLLSIANGASLFGRILPGFMADRYGHYNLIFLSMVASAVIAFCWTTVTDLAGLIVWSAAYGFSSGVSNSSFFFAFI